MARSRRSRARSACRCCRPTAASSRATSSSDRDVPPFARAGMDGYAVVAEDTFGASRFEPKTLRVVEKVYTGQVPTRRVGAGEAAEIATGAPMPEGADAVVMVEETERAATDDVQHSHAGLSAPERRQAGRRHRAAARPCCAPATCSIPSRIGALAALGITDVEVFAKPSVAILSTGNEIVEPGSRLEPGQIYDINRYHAEHDHRRARRHARRVSDGAGHARGSRARDRSLPRRRRAWCSRAAARSASAI